MSYGLVEHVCLRLRCRRLSVRHVWLRLLRRRKLAMGLLGYRLPGRVLHSRHSRHVWHVIVHVWWCYGRLLLLLLLRRRQWRRRLARHILHVWWCWHCMLLRLEVLLHLLLLLLVLLVLLVLLHWLLLVVLLLHLLMRPTRGSHGWRRYWLPPRVLRLSWRRRRYSAIVRTDRGVGLRRKEN